MNQPFTPGEQDYFFMNRAIALAREGMRSGKGGPFGCVIVQGNEIIGEGNNEVLSGHDPTAHAEVVAIRRACKKTGSHQLTGAVIYTSCEPCPMCLGAIYWARPDRVIFANTRQQAAAICFDDDFIYREIDTAPGLRKIPFIHAAHPDAEALFEEWDRKEDKKTY